MSASEPSWLKGPGARTNDMVHTRALPVSGRDAATTDAVEAAPARLSTEVKAVSERLTTGGSTTTPQPARLAADLAEPAC